MTTDTALALLRDAAGNLYMAYNAFTRNDAIAWEPLKETADRITALLDSAIKDAGDDVVERPKYDSYEDSEQGDIAYATDVSNYIDTLLSAYKLACVERDEAVNEVMAVLEKLNGEHLFRLDAESERDEFRKDAERYRWLRDKEVSIRIGGIASPDDDSSEIEVQCLRQIPEVLDSAIDSARNK